MAGSGIGIIIISPVLQEALSKATLFVAGRVSLPWISFRSENLKVKFEELVELLTAIQAVVEGAEEMQETDPAIKLWLEMLRDAVYGTVDVLDEVEYSVLEKVVEIRRSQKQQEQVTPQDREHSSFSPSNLTVQKERVRQDQELSSFSPPTLTVQTQKQQEQVHTFFSPSTLIVDFDQEMGDKFTEIIESFSEIRKKVDFIDLMIPFRKNSLAIALPNYDDIFHLFDDMQLVVGRENDVSEIVDLLLRLRIDHSISGISIVGMVGIGKTAVASSVYRKSGEKSIYDLVFWVSVSEDLNDERILREMLECCDISAVPANGESTIDQLVQCLGEDLKMKTFLLIFDDLREKDSSKWNEFASNLSKVIETSKGRCSIILTTQSKRVASAIQKEKFAMHTRHMKLLSDDECWSIIKETVLRLSCETCIQSDLEDVGKKISKQCGGLPLVAVMIGETLSRQFQRNNWLAISKNDSWLLNSEDGNKILSALKASSFDRLSSPLKKCFSYCSIFPKGCHIKRCDLIQHWIAQGFLHQPNGSMMAMEDVGNEYCSDLLSNSLFQQIRVRDNYRMHDIVYNLALFVSKGETLVWKDGCSVDDDANILHLRLEDYQGRIPEEAIEKLRSLVSRHNSRFLTTPFGPKSLRCLECNGDQLIHPSFSPANLKYLGITSVHHYALQRLLPKLYKLKTLKLTRCADSGYGSTYKLLSCMSLENLKISYCDDLTSITIVEELTSLESLELLNCERLRSLLLELESCRHLKNLRISGCPNLTSIPNFHGSSSLERLELINCRSLTSLLVELGSCSHLKELTISECPELTSIPRIHGSSSLESLELTSCDKLTHLPVELGSCISLKRLIIWDCSHLISAISKGGSSLLESFELRNCKQVESIAGSSSLESLERSKGEGLVNFSARLGTFIQNKELRACSTLTSLLPMLRTLSSLKDLCISRCSHLTSIESIGGSSSLERLEVSFCDRLKSLSVRLGTLDSLKSLKISNCHSLVAIDSMAGLSSLESLELRNCFGLRSLPRNLDSCQSLKNLGIFGCFCLVFKHKMEGILSLESLEVEDCNQLRFLPLGPGSYSSLQRLIIRKCHLMASIPKNMVKLPSLLCLEIAECGSLESIAGEWLESLTSLRELTMGPFSSELEEFPGFASIHHLRASLKIVRIRGWDKLESLPPQLEQLTALEELELRVFRRLRVLPDWFGNLTSLQRLKIEDCYYFSRLPSADVMQRLSNLQSIRITKCFSFIEQEWPEFSHTFLSRNANHARHYVLNGPVICDLRIQRELEPSPYVPFSRDAYLRELI